MQATLLSLHLADPKGQVTQVPRSHLAQQGCLLCDHPGSPRAWGELMPGSASGNNNEEDDGAGRNTRDLERPQSPGVSGKGSRSTGVLSSVLPIAGNGEGRNRASRSVAGSKPGFTSGILGFWMRNWFTHHQVSVPGTQNAPEMSLYSPGHYLGHGTGWRST